MPRSLITLVALGLLLVRGAHAQASKPKPKPESPAHPHWAASASGGAVQLSDSASFRALGGVVQYRPLEWLSLGAAPTIVSGTASGSTTTGFGDLPLGVEASREFAAPSSPEIAAAVILTLPTGNAACGLGSGVGHVGVDLGAGLSPSDAVHLSVAASRSLSGVVTQSSFDPPGATWLSIDGDIDLTPRWTLSLSWGGDLGGMDSSAAPRELGAGTRYSLGGPLTMAVDVIHGVAGDAPRWGVALSIGTASTGLSVLNPTSPLQRQRQVFVSSASPKGGRRGGGGTGTTITTCP
ncbi:MAG TPA: hypothetical protein VH158_10980 [Gemmatimonadales bacterium]|jgi:hypothetical protein|nr:hypothetical protein [Gemmatimonadales bacterium]